MKKENSSHYKRSKKLKALRFGQYTLNAIGIIVLCYGVYEAACLFLNYKRCETSNDAQIEQYISPINIRVPGYVKKVYFTEHQFVHKGDTLLVLDDREYRIRVSEAEAALKDAENGIAILSSSLTTTQATASVYDASIEEINTRISKLQKDLTRYRNLLQRNAATPIQVEQLETELTATLAKLEALKKQKAAATSGVNEVTNRKASVEAGILRAQAALWGRAAGLSSGFGIRQSSLPLGTSYAGRGRFYSLGGSTASTAGCSMISYISRATSLVRGSTSESTRTLMGRLPKVTSMMSPALTA